ncbi:hypothetical protein GW930_01055 [Candidatus Saccharibacteria bacterium]|nr:hypothetical protein [Candidatus Saccharibacteria bacterium]
MRKITTLTLTCLLVVFAAPVAIFAQAPSDNGQNTTNRPDVTKIREQAKADAEESRTPVEQRKSEIVKQVEQRRIEVRKEVCERHQRTLSDTMPRLTQAATSVKQSMDGLYSRVAGFYESSQLTVATYGELVANVEVAKANSEAAIATIDGQVFTLDCENSKVGEQLDGYRLSVQDAKPALKEYKSALVELISTMQSAADNQDEGDSENA